MLGVKLAFLLNVIALNSDSAYLLNGLLLEHSLRCVSYFVLDVLASQNMSKVA